MARYLLLVEVIYEIRFRSELEGPLVGRDHVDVRFLDAIYSFDSISNLVTII